MRSRSSTRRCLLFQATPRIMDTAALVYLALDRNLEAVGLLRKAVGAAPENTEISFHLAEALAKIGENAEARDVLDRMLAGGRQFPERSQAQELLRTLPN